MNSKEDIWKKILELLEQEFTRTTIDTWFDDAVVQEFDGSSMVIVTSHEMKRDIITQKFMDPLQRAIGQFYPGELQLQFMTEQEYQTYVNQKQLGPAAEQDEHSFDSFVVGPSNKFAYAAAVSVSANPGAAYNPLFIYGPSGLGKTHLLNAIAYDFSRKFPGKESLYITSEDFTIELISSISRARMQEFREKYRKIDLLLVDDVQFIAGKESTQEEFFHTFNALHEANKQIVLTSDRTPKEIPKLESRMQSRFEMGLLASIAPPEFETRCAIVLRKAHSLQADLPQEVVEFIANKITSNVRQLEGAVKKMVALHTFMNVPLDMNCAQEAINDIFKENPGLNPTAEYILDCVSNFFGVEVKDITSAKRGAEIAQIRHISVYLIRDIAHLSLPEIGAKIGGRDHSTISNSINRIEAQLKKDETLRTTIDNLKKAIREG